MEYKIREMLPSNTETYVNLCFALDKETSFMLYEPGERYLIKAEQKQKFDRLCHVHIQRFSLSKKMTN